MSYILIPINNINITSNICIERQKFYSWTTTVLFLNNNSFIPGQQQFYSWTTTVLFLNKNSFIPGQQQFYS